MAGANAVLVGGTGVSGTLNPGTGQTAEVLLKIAPDAAPGPHEIRLVTPKGMSNPGYLWIGTLPEMLESGGNNDPAHAMNLMALPATLSGRLDKPQQTDWYTVRVEAGETLVCEMCAQRIYSPLDAVLELHDSEGRLVATAAEGYDNDPVLVYPVKTAGVYRVQVRDTLYRGGAGFVYRLSVGAMPYISALFPAGGRGGETLNATVEGVNLGGTKTLTVPLPSETPAGTPFYIVPETGRGDALPVRIALDDLPQRTAAETTSLAKPQFLDTIPVTINGRIVSSKQGDCYAFKADALKPLTLTLLAHRIGSRLQPTLRVLDAAGKELMSSEEQAGRDPQLVFTPSAAGEYRAEVSSLDGVSGTRSFYRLSIAPPGAPDFHLTVTPDVVTVGRGATLLVSVRAVRTGGWNGAISLRVAGVPPGLTASPLVLAPGQNEGTISLTAAPDAPLTNAPLRVVGEGMPDGKNPVQHTATPMANLPRPGENRLEMRPVQFQMATLTDAASSYTLIPETTELTLVRGQSASLKVRAVRKPNDGAANGAIALTLAGLPPGVTAQAPAIADKQTESLLTFTVAANAAPGTLYVVLNGKIGNNPAIPAPVLVITLKEK